MPTAASFPSGVRKSRTLSSSPVTAIASDPSPLRSHGAAVPGVAVTDTIVLMEEGEEYAAARYLERDALSAVQTPQVCRFEPLAAAHAWAHEQKVAFTDGGGLLAARGLIPAVVMGERDNWKITAESDWARAEVALKGR